MNRQTGRGRTRGRGGRNSKQFTPPKGLFANQKWHCNCDPRLPAERFKVKKEGKNHGRWFYTCQQNEPQRCDFFLWEEDAKPREEAAVLSNSRSEPQISNLQEKQTSRGSSGGFESEETGKGLSSRGKTIASEGDEGTNTTSRISPPNLRSNPTTASILGKRNAKEANLVNDDEFSHEARMPEKVANPAAPETPHKAQKIGVYATPATTGKRKLPWLEQPATPKLTRPGEADFPTPSKLPDATTARKVAFAQPETPSASTTLANAHSPSPISRYKDALDNPADSSSSLTSSVLASLASVSIPDATMSQLRTILTTHDLRAQGVVKGRDISRLGLKAKDIRITELQARIASLEAEREVDRGVIRTLREEKRRKQQSEGGGR